MIGKDVYSYQYMDSFEKFKKNKVYLKNTYYSKLQMNDIPNNDDEHAKQVCNTMEKNKLGCYHNTCLFYCCQMYLRHFKMRA